MKYTKFIEKVKKQEGRIPALMDGMKKIKEKGCLKFENVENHQVDGVWKVRPIYLFDKTVAVVCPYCKKIHIHGWNDGKYTGERIAHCEESEGNIYDIDYIIA